MKVIELQKLSVEEIINQQPLPDKLLRLFAVWCYRETLQWIDDPDPRSIEAVNVAERYVNGQATDNELIEVESTAMSAAGVSVLSLLRSTTCSVVCSAVRSAERSAVWLAGYKKNEISNKQKDKLIEMITEMNKIDKILYRVE